MKKKDLTIIIALSLVAVIALVFIVVRTNNVNKNVHENLSLDNQLVNKEWTWSSTVMANDEIIVPVEKDSFTITFSENGEFNGTTDCNNFFGQYEMENNKIVFGSIASTKMYCEGSQELDFITTLAETDHFVFNKDGDLVLILKLDSGSMIFSNKISEENVSPIADESLTLVSQLIDKEWTWNSTLMNNDEIITPIEKDSFTITFSENGEFNGTTDCNNFFGEYKIEKNNISFPQIGSTQMYCEGSQEFDFITTLAEVDQFMFNEEGQLVFLLKLDSGSMIFGSK